MLPLDGSTLGNLATREARSRAAGRPVGEEEDEAVMEKALALGLVVKGRGRGGPSPLKACELGRVPSSGVKASSRMPWFDGEQG